MSTNLYASIASTNTNLNTEISNRIASDNLLTTDIALTNTNLNTEINNRITSDNLLSTNIGTINSSLLIIPKLNSANTFTSQNNFTSVSCTGLNCGNNIDSNTLQCNSITTNYIVLNNSAQTNTTIGYQIPNSGVNNSIFGYRAMMYNFSGTSNSSFGALSLNNLVNGSYNNAYGCNSLYNCSSGSQNAVFGYNAATSISFGSYNTSVGNYAGSTLDVGNYCSFFGYNTRTTESYAQKSSAIGSGSVITKSNQIVLGTNTEEVTFPGSIVMSIGVISTTITLTTLLSNYMCNNTIAINITLPYTVSSGSCITIRRSILSTASVTILGSSLVAFNSVVSTTILPNNICSSYIFYNNVWYQQSSF